MALNDLRVMAAQRDHLRSERDSLLYTVEQQSATLVQYRAELAGRLRDDGALSADAPIGAEGFPTDELLLATARRYRGQEVTPEQLADLHEKAAPYFAALFRVLHFDDLGVPIENLLYRFCCIEWFLVKGDMPDDVWREACSRLAAFCQSGYMQRMLAEAGFDSDAPDVPHTGRHNSSPPPSLPSHSSSCKQGRSTPIPSPPRPCSNNTNRSGWRQFPGRHRVR